MAIKVAINGFGRIGRLVMRGLANDKSFNLVAVNDLTNVETLAHLLKYDSVHGKFPGDVKALKSGHIKAGSRKFKIYSETDPANLPWKKHSVDVVIESTGFFRKRKDAAKHIEAGAKKVIISAPSPDADIMIVMGVNHKSYKKSKHQVIQRLPVLRIALLP